MVPVLAVLARGQTNGVDMTAVWYLCHPVAGDVPGNLARARKWLRWMHLRYPEPAILAPWLLDLEVMPNADQDPEQRELGLRRCEAVARLCDAVVLVGGRITDGMRREADAAKKVIDWTHLGSLPPDGEPT